MTDTAIIEERDNGPLVVKGLTRLTGPDGEEIEVKPVMALCRCGGSDNKPFCDGTHNDNGFESRGGTPAGKDVLLPYKGEAVTLLFNPRLCSHAAECGARAPKAFDPSQKPWINPDAETVEKLEEVVRACPSGALQIEGRGHLVGDDLAVAAEDVADQQGPRGRACRHGGERISFSIWGSRFLTRVWRLPAVLPPRNARSHAPSRSVEPPTKTKSSASSMRP